ncbi:MAG: hypothetical protein ABSA58_21045 [Acetobacteraceae bacterium]
MTDKPHDEEGMQTGVLFHLPKRRVRKSLREQVSEEVELSIAGHIREQNQLLRDLNQLLSDKVQRLTTGVEHLVEEMHGVRTGKKEEAFARVGPAGAPPDLPTVSAEAAVIYTHSAEDIGKELGFRASEIGVLLGSRGLCWAGNGDYQELGRHKKKSQQKWWHREVPERLRKVLDAGITANAGTKDKSVLAVFRKWKQRKENQDLLEEMDLATTPHLGAYNAVNSQLMIDLC